MIRKNFIMTNESADRTGIVAALTECLARHDGFITELSQFGTPSSERFYSRIAFNMGEGDVSVFKREMKAVSADFDLKTKIIPAKRKTKTLIMVSKFDHCLADLIYRVGKKRLNCEVVGIVSNHETARPLAVTAGLAYHHIPITTETKPQAEQVLRNIIEASGAELIILARYMQVLSDSICRDYSGRIINIHHSFLPSFKGAKPYHRAYERGVKLIGATAHYVTADLDEGPIIEQGIQRVDHTKTPAKLIDIGRDVESQTLAEAVRLHTEHRAFLNGAKTVILP
ncbi:formyltetrahydrofolate deformylase [Hellea balneolensis]|uniref:formyltetrahydrofolate deformylase n=1 Tax=Hellea balneolensis TaxID=287478 RepID=UPI00040D1247|nr:formyltetrahydrofolate deformylase [Hellea balneolensis]